MPIIFQLIVWFGIFRPETTNKIVNFKNIYCPRLNCVRFSLVRKKVDISRVDCLNNSITIASNDRKKYGRDSDNRPAGLTLLPMIEKIRAENQKKKENRPAVLTLLPIIEK